jgi:hypothetical protein
MPRIPIFKRALSQEGVGPPKLLRYTPRLTLKDIAAGVDNLRHDVYLSPKFVEQMRLQLARLIARHGNVETVLIPESSSASSFGSFRPPSAPQDRKSEPAEMKALLLQLHVSGLNRAKAINNISVDLLARLAVVKFLRAELAAQFAQVLERCRTKLKALEGVRQQSGLELRERVAAFQIGKKTVLRRAGQELFQTLLEIEKETLARMRRSLFGSDAVADYRLFLHRMILTEDGRDDYLNAEYYVMFGNWDRDSDRFPHIREIICSFLTSLDLGRESEDLAVLDSWLNAPENADVLIAGGNPDVSTAEGRAQEGRLAFWTELLESAKVLDSIIASYEVVPLLAEYSPRINAQQLKNGLISRSEQTRVLKLIEEHGRLSTDSYQAAINRAANCRGAERVKVAARFMRDFLRYHRDLRRLEALNSALDSINVIGNEKLRELSAVNGTLYEFVLPEEQRPVEEKVLHHVILKADIRDSTRLTRSLLERGLNPASYFSLNFFDPVYKLLPKYGAFKVFLEGDAMILAILEKEGESRLSVSRACVLAREMLEIVNGYNQLLARSGLPALELGIGISFQDSAPLYLMDGDQRIMISDALNESDRLSSCNKRARKVVEPVQSKFHVYAFQVLSHDDAGESADDLLLPYNLNGIRISEAAFNKLKQEVSLQQCHLDLPTLFANDQYVLYSALVPVGNDIFRKIIIRQSRVAQVDPRTSAFRNWTERCYYEVCSNPAIYAMLEEGSAASA